MKKKMKQMLEIFKTIATFCMNHLVAVVLAIIILILGFKIYSLSSNNEHLSEIIAKNEKDHVTTIVNYDKDFKDLKNENRELYDSLKEYKDQIDFLVQFKYSKEYVVDTVWVEKKNENVVVYETNSKGEIKIDENGDKVLAQEKVYTYTNDSIENDTLKYNLQIGSLTQPNWYKLKFNITDQFTIVNKSVGDANETTIKTASNADVSDITVFQKKTKTSFWKRFAVGPQVGVGYDVVNNKVGVQVGVGVTFNLLKTK